MTNMLQTSSRRRIIGYLVFGLVALVMCLACIGMGIPSLVRNNWEELQMSVGGGISRGMFKDCSWNTDSCVMLDSTSFGRSQLGDRILNLRRSHAAFMIMAICLSAVAGAVFLIGLLYILVKSQCTLYDFRCCLLRRILLACGIICMIGFLFYIIAFLCFHVRIAEELLDKGTSGLADTLGYYYANLVVGNASTHYYSGMYGLGWGSCGALFLAACLFLIPTHWCCCCNTPGSYTMQSTGSNYQRQMNTPVSTLNKNNYPGQQYINNGRSASTFSHDSRIRRDSQYEVAGVIHDYVA